ncbi:hypothetical protein [Thermococcus sp. 2319x1]|uniref:hypothetical protein n=1 Tax=Thermococcus sp. 2319x1 TaxID=1674923 RepID=UPI00158415B0|nr:hypothetical protein [Thermococcus sp. 2319x1]
MNKVQKLILALLIIEIIVTVPIIDRVLYGRSDPFVAHVIVSAYVVERAGNLEGVSEYLSQAYNNTNEKAWIWQAGTRSLIENKIVGAILSLYIAGLVSNIDYKFLGYSPIIYLVYVLIFTIILRNILYVLYNSKFNFPKLGKFVVTSTIIAIWIDFLNIYAFRHFIGFQYHAVAVVYYLSIIFLLIKLMSQKRATGRIVVLIIVAYTSALITHYRFPTLILGSVLLSTIFFKILGIFAPNFREISQTFGKTVIVLFTLLCFQPFYWTVLKYKSSNFLNVTFILEYILQILSGQKKAGSAYVYSSTIFTELQRYNIYLLFLSWGATILLLLLLTFKFASEIDPPEILYLWGIGSAITSSLTYFLYYGGFGGLSISEPWIVGIGVIPFLTRIYKNINSRHRQILATIVILLFSTSLILGDILSLYFSKVYPNFPEPPRNQADTSLSFVWSHILFDEKAGIIIGSSFPVSAELYEETAKYNTQLLQYVGFRRIVDEVLEFKDTKDKSKLLKLLVQKNDYLIITKYEYQNGLSSDVFGLQSYLLPPELKVFKLTFSSVYTSDIQDILLLG